MAVQGVKTKTYIRLWALLKSSVSNGKTYSDLNGIVEFIIGARYIVSHNFSLMQ